MEFDRFKMLINEDKFNKLQDATVLILGLGGVGGSAAVNLVRSGVGHIILIDDDTVDITNINRQVIAFHSTIGLKKVDVLEKLLLDINKSIKITKLPVFYKEENKDIILNSKIDYILDCCDTINSKKVIIKQALENNISIISAMGTGNRFNPLNLVIRDIRETSYDPIARILRKWLKDEQIYNKIDVVTSLEHPQKLNNKVVGSTSFVPNAAGTIMAYFVVNKIMEIKK
ncbi:MAG: ThiF family adenylyltransferase [Bacilli bacterium]